MLVAADSDDAKEATIAVNERFLHAIESPIGPEAQL
jgi:hypothetical protein